MMAFPCTQCGACCKSIDGISFLELFNENGQCNKLKGNSCTIYETRPLLCNIEQSYIEIFSQYMTLEEFYTQNALACNQLQEKQCIPLQYRVKVNF